MDINEWQVASRTLKDVQIMLHEMLLLSTKTKLGEDCNPCAGCDKLMVPYLAWQRIPVEDRSTMFAAECTGTGLCASCAGRERAKMKKVRTGGPLDEETVRRLREAVNLSPRKFQ